MLVAYITDLHAHNYKQFDIKGSRLRVVLQVIDDVYKFAVKNGITIILFGGDLYDKENAIPTVVINVIIAKFAQKSKEHPYIVWLAISGNHDHASKNLWGSPAVSALEHLAVAFPDNFILIDNDVKTFIDGMNLVVSGIPYYEFPEHYNKALTSANTLQTNSFSGFKKSVLMIHQTPKGANPMIPWDTDPYDPLYDAWDLVLCGHIHTKEDLLDSFVIGGSPLHRDLADAGDEKGWWVFDSEDPKGTLTFVSTKGRYPEYHRVSGEMPEGLEGHYVVLEPDLFDELTEEQNIEVEKFSAGLSPSQLIKNFWETVDGEDEKLLEQGLEFVK